MQTVFRLLRLQVFSDTLASSFDIMDSVTDFAGDGEQTNLIG